MWPFDSGSSTKRISKTEFGKVRSRLLERGYSPAEVDRVEGFFWGSLNESESSQKGIDQREMDQTLEWMAKNPSAHRLSDSKLQILKESLHKHL